MEAREVNHSILTPVNFLNRSAEVYPDKVAVVYGDKRFTYREFKTRVENLAGALSKLGLVRGDKVAFLCPNTPPLLEAHYGVPMIGGVLVAINTRLSPGEIKYILNHSESRVLVIDAGYSKLIESIINGLTNIKAIVTVCEEGFEKRLTGPEYENFLATGAGITTRCPIENELETISINYTSGTTGFLKGVMYSYRGVYLNALDECIEHGLNSDTVYLWTLPMFHCNGWCFTWAVTAVGGVHVCLRRFQPEQIYDLIEKEGVNVLCAEPTALKIMYKYPYARISTKLRVITAGSPPSPTVIMNMEKLGDKVDVAHVYGLTEVYGPHSICAWQHKWDGLPVEEKAKIKTRQGVAYINASFMKVVEPGTMREVKRDGRTMGEVVMRGNNVMLGYYKQIDATEEAFRGGWFHSGDLAVVHPDGYIEIKDRFKDIIISGGENISSIEVENLINEHPDVEEVVVIAIPDPKWGEVPKAYVVLKPGVNPSADDIINFCNERIAKFKVPKVIEFGELPKTSSGKVMKYRLREKEWKGFDKRIN